MAKTLEHDDIVNWVKCGDIVEADNMVSRLETTLISLATDENYRKTIDAGVMLMLSKSELSFIAQMLDRKPTIERNKNNKSGRQLMVNVLVQNKPIRSQSRALWLAKTTSTNITNTNTSEFERVASFVNSIIYRNNKILADFKNGKCQWHEGYQPSFPKRAATSDEIKKAYYKFVKTGFIDKADMKLNKAKQSKIKPNQK